MSGTSVDPYDTQKRSKVGEYLNLVETRVLKPLASTAVHESCSTTLLLVFAMVDALGKLVHPNTNVGPGQRFKYFLRFLGPEYKKLSKELWKLRNALVHNVINVESYLSWTELEGWVHLQRIGGSGLGPTSNEQARMGREHAARHGWWAGSDSASAGSVRKDLWLIFLPLINFTSWFPSSCLGTTCQVPSCRKICTIWGGCT